MAIKVCFLPPGVTVGSAVEIETKSASSEREPAVDKVSISSSLYIMYHWIRLFVALSVNNNSRLYG